MQRISSPFAEGNDFTGVKLYFLGSFNTTYKEKIKEVLRKFGIEVSEKLDETVTYVVLGCRVNKGIHDLLSKDIQFILPDHLEPLLQKFQSFQPKALEELEKENLTKLLFSPDENNQKIAVEILTQQEFSTDISYLIYIVFLVHKEVFPFKVALYTTIRNSIYLPYCLKIINTSMKIRKMNLYLDQFQDVWMDKEKFIKNGLDLFEEEHLKPYYYQFIDFGGSLNVPIAYEYLRKEIKDSVLDLRELYYRVGESIPKSYGNYTHSNFLDSHMYVNFKHFDGSKFPEVKELWLKDKRGGNYYLHLYMINSFTPNQLEKVKIYYGAYNLSDNLKEFWRDNDKNNIITLYAKKLK